MTTTRQAEKILALLRSAHGGWVPLPEIMACAAQYNARVFELRQRGLNIENRTETMGNGSRHSWFRLVTDAPVEHGTADTQTTDPGDWYASKYGQRPRVDPEALFLVSHTEGRR